MKHTHSLKRFDWIKENYLLEKLSIISKYDLFELTEIFLIQIIFEPNKNLLKSNKFLL